jgi:hypothetical protein
VAAGLMAQPVYPQLRKFPCGPALTLRARFGSASEKQSKPMNYLIVAICTAGNVEVSLIVDVTTLIVDCFFDFTKQVFARRWREHPNIRPRG